MSNLNNELTNLENRLKAAGVSTEKFSERMAQAGSNQEELVRLTREMQIELSNVEGTASNLYDRLNAITGEMKKGNAAINLAAGAYTKLTRLASQLSDDEAGLVDLNKTQLKKILEKAKSEQ